MDLMNLLPDYYKDNKTTEELQKILSVEIDKVVDGLDKTIDQCFINTVTKLLSRYEDMYKISIDISKSDEFRRKRIKSKMRGVGTTTKAMVKRVASSYSDGDVKVVEDNANYRFIIEFIGTLSNIADLIITIDEIKPAHLSYDIGLNLKQKESEIFIGMATISGEEITVYPYSPKELSSKGKIYIATGSNTGVENMTVYPRKEVI